MNSSFGNDTVFSHYRIVSEIGKGGMGDVFLAQDTRLDREVALKILPVEFANDKDRMSRFVREAKAASALNHPNIITIYEIGEVEGTHFIATEFIDGQTLRDWSRNTPLVLNSALEIAIQIALALDEAHSAGIIHRDIKPDNVMIRANGLVKILDFGIAKLSEQQTNSVGLKVGAEDATAIQPPSTSPGMIIGTANYMSPEQAKGRVVDTRTDIFSFGVVMYEMIAGRLPFEGENTLEMIGSILNKEPQPLSSAVPAEIARIIGKCLRKAANDRYQTIKDVGNDLKEAKQELEYRNKSDKTVSSHNEQKTQLLNATTVDEKQQTTTGANRNNSITIRKSSLNIFLIGALATLIICALGLGYWLYFRNPTKQINSIAVMPFVNESRNEDVEYLSDGMTETLISTLSNLPNLNVKPRSTVFRYKGRETDPQTIAKELNVQAILNGKVVQRGQEISLFIELMDVALDKVIWSENYVRKQSDLVMLQSDIARDVSAKLKSKLSGADEAKLSKSYTTDSEAYQLYLKGLYHWNKRTYDDLLKAIEQFKAAIEQDNNFALAYSGLADTYSVLPYYRGSKSGNAIRQAKPFALRAVELDDQLPEAHSALAFVNEKMWEWDEAEKHYKRAIEINPSYAYAQMRYARFEVRVPQRNAEALDRMKRALEVEPSSLVANDNLSQIYLVLNEVDLAIEQAKRTVDLDPRFSYGWVDLAYAQVRKGQNVEALASANKAVEVSNRSSRSLICLGFVNAVSGKTTQAMTIIRELEEGYKNGQSDASEVAAVYAGLGDKEQAFQWLNKAFADRSSLLVDIRAEFPFASLHYDPQFEDLMKRMNMPDR